MGFRTVIIKNRAKLELRLNSLIIRGEQERKIYIGEINTLIVQSTAVSLTASLLSELIRNNIKVIFCDEKHNPQAELLPYYGAHNTSKRYKEQIAWDYKELQPSDYFKSAGVKLEKNYDSLEEKIVCYINALIELKKCEFFIFVNLKSVLNDEKLALIYSHCKKEQVGLLLVESCKQRPLRNDERAVIITEDLCEIVENY